MVFAPAPLDVTELLVNALTALLRMVLFALAMVTAIAVLATARLAGIAILAAAPTALPLVVSPAAVTVLATVELATAPMAGKAIPASAPLLAQPPMKKYAVAMVLAIAVFAPAMLASVATIADVRTALSMSSPTPLAVSLMPLLSALVWSADVMEFVVAPLDATEHLASAQTVPSSAALFAVATVTATAALVSAMMAGRMMLVTAQPLAHHLMTKCAVVTALATVVNVFATLASAVLTVVVRIALSTNLPTPLVVSLMPLLSALD
jgi:hypothetical protein